MAWFVFYIYLLITENLIQLPLKPLGIFTCYPLMISFCPSSWNDYYNIFISVKNVEIEVANLWSVPDLKTKQTKNLPKN